MPAFRSFSQFYPYYLAAHRTAACRRLHFLGTALVIGVMLAAGITRTGSLLLLAPPVGYGCAWLGHVLFEHNRPATFGHPLYSLAGDFRMFFDILRGKIPL
jgi:hypothetical protein